MEFNPTISNKIKLTPRAYKSEPEYMVNVGWVGGYPFAHFWSNCYFLLDELGKSDGIQQLCHHYYLKNGSIGCKETVMRIKKFIQ